MGWIVIIILILLAAGYGGWQYFTSGEAAKEAAWGIDPVEGCKVRMLGCGCMSIIALLIIGYIISKFQ